MDTNPGYGVTRICRLVTWRSPQFFLSSIVLLAFFLIFFFFFFVLFVCSSSCFFFVCFLSHWIMFKSLIPLFVLCIDCFVCVLCFFVFPAGGHWEHGEGVGTGQGERLNVMNGKELTRIQAHTDTHINLIKSLFITLSKHSKKRKKKKKTKQSTHISVYWIMSTIQFVSWDICGIGSQAKQIKVINHLLKI